MKKLLESICGAPDKPAKLIERLVRASSNKGDLILDPFAGSGSTVIAATVLDRRYITIEKDENYHAIVKKRIHQHHNPLSNFIVDL